jgi:Flp pilus assembly protein TadD
MYSFVKAGMNRQIASLVVLVALLFLGACARPLATGPLAAGVAAACEDRWDEAVQYWKKALEQSPDSAAAHNNLAVAYEKRGAFDEAGREYETALRLAPANAEILLNYEAFKARLEAGRRKGP